MKVLDEIRFSPDTTDFTPIFNKIEGLKPDVVVTGARLGKLVDLINEHGLASVSAVDARYAGTLGRGPWVAAITIARIDKPAAGLG